MRTAPSSTMPAQLWLLLVVPLLGIASCASEDPGIAPPRDAFYFPTGLALDPKRPILYVSNSNADLRYSGGTLTALDLRRLPTDLTRIGETAGAGSGRRCDRTTDCPAGEVCGGAGACVELDCRPDPLAPGRWECPESQFINESATVRIGDFPSELRIDAEGTRLFVPVRGQNYLAWIDVAELSESACREQLGRSGPCVDLRCDDRPDTGCGGVGDRDCPAWDCDTDHRVTFSDRRRDTLPAEPFGIFWHRLVAVHVDAEGERSTCLDGRSDVPCDCATAAPCLAGDGAVDCCIDPPGLDHIYVAHLAGGEVSYFASRPQSVELMDFTGGFFNPESGIRGGFSLAPQLHGDSRSSVFVSSRVENAIGSFVIRDDERIIRTRRVAVGALEPGSDVRGIAFGPGGDVLYAINRAPPALVALDMTEQDGRELGEALWAVEVCSEPSVLKLVPGPSSVDRADQLAFVVCFSEAQIYIVDTATARIVGRVATGEGPNAIEVDEANQRAFIANFAENTVGIIDLDPSRRTYLTMVVRIGLARAPERG